MVADKVRQVVSEYVGREVTAATSLEVGLGLNTNDVFDLVIEIESSFPIMIPDADALRWATVRDIIAYVEPRVGVEKIHHVSFV